LAQLVPFGSGNSRLNRKMFSLRSPSFFGTHFSHIFATQKHSSVPQFFQLSLRGGKNFYTSSPTGCLIAMFPASINRPNLKFHFLPTRVRRKKPASFGQIAENFVFREKLLLSDQRKLTTLLRTLHNKG